jgi:site-specific DNA recombinase
VYYRDAAKARRIPCPTGGNLMIRVDMVHEQFGELLKNLVLPENWREVIRRDMMAKAFSTSVTPETVERERDRRLQRIIGFRMRRPSVLLARLVNSGE